MPTLFERIDSSLQGNHLSVNLTTQVDRLSTVATTVIDLIEHPPQNIGDLTQTLNELPLPNLQIGGKFATTLTQLKTAIPTDLSSVTGDLLAGLQGLQASVDSDLTQVLAEVLQAVLAVYQLTQIDLRCEDATLSVSRLLTQPLARGSDPVPAAALASADPAPATGIAAATAQVEQLLSILNLAPSSFNVETSLDWLHRSLTFSSRNQVLPQSLPIFDDLLDPLETLLTWKGMTSAEILNHMGQSLATLQQFIRSTVHQVLANGVKDWVATMPNLSETALAGIADDLTTALNQLRTAVQTGDLSGTSGAIAQINTRLDQYNSLRPQLQITLLNAIPALNRRLLALPDELADQISHLLSVLQPNGQLGALPGIAAATVSADTVIEAEIEQQFKPLLDWIENLSNQLDLTAIKAPLESVTASTRSLVDSLDQNVAAVTLQVQNLFGQVDSFLAQVDIEAIVNQVKAAIQTFATQLTQQLTDLFQPVQDAISQVVQTIGNGVDSFNPQEIVDALRQVIQSLTGVLKDPQVVAALTEIRNAIETVAQQLKALSFTPVTDQVVAAIDDITATLGQIDTSLLDNTLKLALQAAILLLPEDLTPFTNPLIDEFDQLIETGPIPILDQVKQQPEKLLAQVKGFQPATLIGNALGKPYQNLLKQAETFQPSHLLEPVQGELDKLKARLQKDANPGAAIQPLEEPFNQILQAFDRLQPEALVQPLEAAIATTVDTILSALPLDQVFSPVDNALKTVESALTLSQRLTALLQKIKDLLAGFANSQPQVETWITSILEKIEAIADTSALQPRFTDLSTALDETKAAALLTQFNNGIDPLLAILNTLNPQTRLTTLIQAYGNFPQTALAALPDPQKVAIAAIFQRFNPLNPDFSAPYQALASYQQALNQTQQNLQITLANWDSLYHAEGGILSDFYVSTSTAAQLRQWVESALRPQLIQPFKAFFTLLEPLQSALSGVLSVVQTTITTLETKLSELLLGPQSLAEIRDTLQTLVQRLREFNLGFLRDSLTHTFAQVRGKLTALDPSQLRQAIETAFGEMLNLLNIEQILPAAQIQALDDDYTEVIDKLKALDPETLVIQLIQPEFDEKIVPLLETFDVTQLFTALIDRLKSLDEELKAEMERVNQAYQKLRSAIPPISIDLDIDIGVSL
jgi:uncharacterized protein YjgD (DUF1641 family)